VPHNLCCRSGYQNLAVVEGTGYLEGWAGQIATGILSAIGVFRIASIIPRGQDSYMAGDNGGLFGEGAESINILYVNPIYIFWSNLSGVH